MKTETFRKVNSHSVMITIFFAGVILSCGALYLIYAGLWKDGLQPASILTGLTFFAGILSISLVSHSVRRDVVYLEKRQKNHVQVADTLRVGNKINQDHLEEFIHAEQDWLTSICSVLEAAQGALYISEGDFYEMKYSYALIRELKDQVRYKSGEGVIGRVAVECKPLRIDALPEGYITVVSGLGQSSPRFLMAFPMHRQNNCYGVLELASFTPFTEMLVNEIEIAIGVFVGNRILN